MKQIEELNSECAQSLRRAQIQTQKVKRAEQ